LARGRFLHELQRVVPGFQSADVKITANGGVRRKALQIQGIRLMPED